MGEQRPIFVPGRMKPLIEQPEARTAFATDREVLRAIVNDADLIGRSDWDECFLLVKVPSDVAEYLANLDAETEGLEPDPDEGGTEMGRDPDLEPDTDDEPNGDLEDDRCADQPDFTNFCMAPRTRNDVAELRKVARWLRTRAQAHR